MKRFAISSLLIIILLVQSLYTYGASYESFTPYRGSVDFYKSSNGIRYADVGFNFNSRGISEFDSTTDSYENDLIFYNYDNTAYATSFSTYQSNLPNAYLDTQFLDGDDEAVVTVGSTAADEIQADTYYYVVYTLTGYKSSSSMYKVCPQEGRWYVSASTWTVFSETGNTVIPFKNGFYAPEYREWRTEIETNSSISTATRTYRDDWCSGTLYSTSDSDYWKVYFNGSTDIRLICPSGTDYDIRVYDSSGNKITGSYSTDLDSTKTYTFNPGTYYLKVYSWEGSGSYKNYYMMCTDND